jgi:hypothetical protein
MLVPVSSSYNPQRAWFEHLLFGNVVGADVGAALLSALTSPEWGDGKPRIIRFHPSARLDQLTLEGFQTGVTPILEAHADKLTNQQRAAVVAAHLPEEAISQLYQNVPSIRDSFQFRIFATEAEAIAFLEGEEVEAD